ncbi:MAG: P-loop NTPase [Deltaproteobacteria bacterium]|nr:P-loop NTPase [Deltaproteobacteria bacterium]
MSTQIQKRTRIISVGGGKGGVGKSIVSCNMAVAMAQLGHKTVLADLDLGAANQHLLLGIDRPLPGIEALLSRTVDDARTGLTPTKIPGLSLLAGTGAVVGAANITHGQKGKIIRKLRGLDADVVIIDCGAGVGYNTLDFFELGAQRLVVTTPQVTAIHDAYSFLKGAVVRTLQHHAQNDRERKLLQEVEGSAEGEKVIDLLTRIRHTNPGYAERIGKVLENFGAQLVGNQVTSPNQNGIFHAVSKMIRDYLGISVPIVGWLKDSKEIADSVNDRSPLILSRDAEYGKALRTMAETLLVEEVPLEEELLELDEDLDEGAAGVEASMSPDALRIDGSDDSDEFDDGPLPPKAVGPAATEGYMGNGKVRVYLPPRRKKRPPKKARNDDTGGRRRRRVTLPGMPPELVQKGPPPLRKVQSS